MVHADRPVRGARIGLMGLTFKEDVSDLRNSRVPDIVKELAEFGIRPLVHDALTSPHEALEKYGIELSRLEDLTDLDALILAVNHSDYLRMPKTQLLGRLKDGGVFIDEQPSRALNLRDKALHSCLPLGLT